ncbi:MAG: adenylosuccinate lyase, partial [Armatimonadota bacterium]
VGDDAKWVHYGVTSYDVEDNALSLRMRDACDIIIEDIRKLIATLRTRATEHKWTLQIGRTHGVHAEPITFGFKLCVWIAEMERNLQRFNEARTNINYGKVSGAVGAYANVDPRVEEFVCDKLGLTLSPVSTQIIQRDHHAHVLTTCAIVASSLEQFATEIRNLQRTELLEVQEAFKTGQRGSSAMPHKRNPRLSEQVTGLARVIRSLVIPALENVATWHERDLSNSSAERIIIPDAFVTLDYILNTFNRVMEGLVVYPDNMLANLEKMHGLVVSEQVMLALVRTGLLRDDAYKLVQRNAAKAWEGTDFRSALQEDPDVKDRLSEDDLDHCFDYRAHLQNLEVVFQRMGI